MPTLPKTPIVVESSFAALAGRCPGTAADCLPLVIWNDIQNRDTAPVINRHRDFFSLYIARQGRGTHLIEGAAYAVARGDVYAMGIGMTHQFAECDGLITDTLHFAPSLFDAPTLDALMKTEGFQSLFVEEPLRRGKLHGQGGRWLHLTPDAYLPIADSLAELKREWQSGTPGGVLLTRGLFLRLLIHLARLYADSREYAPLVATSGRDPHEATVGAAVRYLDAHYPEPVRIEQVAASVFLSPDRFTEVFARIMGRTPRDYLRHLRVEQAKRLLATTDLPIHEIGSRSGFGEPAYFTRAFRLATGKTPRDFRNRVFYD